MAAHRHYATGIDRYVRYSDPRGHSGVMFGRDEHRIIIRNHTVGFRRETVKIVIWIGTLRTQVETYPMPSFEAPRRFRERLRE